MVHLLLMHCFMLDQCCTSYLEMLLLVTCTILIKRILLTLARMWSLMLQHITILISQLVAYLCPFWSHIMYGNPTVIWELLKTIIAFLFCIIPICIIDRVPNPRLLLTSIPCTSMPLIVPMSIPLSSHMFLCFPLPRSHVGPFSPISPPLWHPAGPPFPPIVPYFRWRWIPTWLSTVEPRITTTLSLQTTRSLSLSRHVPAFLFDW